VAYVFVGLANWAHLLNDDWFPQILLNTLYFTSMDIGIAFLVSLIFALLLNERFRGKRILNVLLIIPWSVPAITSGLMWQWMLNGEYGIVNGILFQLGIIDHFHVWLNEPDFAMYWVIFVQVWKDVPFLVLLLYAALQTVPQQIYDAASIDGANALQSFRHVTIPSVKLAIFVGLLMQTISSFKVFDIIFKLTGGGPFNTTKVLYYYVYEEGFVGFRFGYATVLSYVVFLVVLVLTIAYLKAFSPSPEIK